MAESKRLDKLASLSRDLLDDLEHARADVLSPADLNRSLRQILKNQVALLEALGALASAPAATSAASQAEPALERPESALQRQIRVRASQGPAVTNGHPRRSAGEGLVELSAADTECDANVVDHDTHRDADHDHDLPETLDEADLGLTSDSQAGADRPAVGQASDEGSSAAEEILGEGRVIPTHLARSFVQQFDNRDQDFSKGLDKLNRWLSAGSSGTPFQWRGERAYLNLNGAGATSARNYEEQLMTRMGFSRRLGRLVVPGLAGEVVVYERPN